MGRLDGKVALVTGAARGQGAAEARLFVAEGARVMMGDVLDDDGEVVAKELGERAAYRHHDVTNEDDWAAIVADTKSQFGRIDVLVNNAGVFRIVGMTATTLDEYMRIVTINQVGTFLGMKAVAETMIGQRAGSIVNISSVAGLSGGAGTIAYSASKFAVRGMTKVAAVELAPFGVRVNSVHPGLIDTTMLRDAFALSSEANVEAVRAAVPNGRLATADDVAKLVLYLASDDSTYSTGSEFVVDGGMTARI
jgi:3alpha(or 20beta)-hydroxysteroid dehydrogenase